MKEKMKDFTVSSRSLWVLFLTVTVVGWSGLSANSDPAIGTAQSSAGRVSQTTDYTSVLSQLDERLAVLDALTASRPDSWLHQERIANLFLERASLTGDTSDYQSAEAALEKAFLFKGKGHGPVLTRAQLNFSLHRMNLIEDDIELAESALLINNSTRSTINGLKADVALNTGQYELAIKLMLANESDNSNLYNATRLANYYGQTAQFEKAGQWWHQAEKRVVGTSPHLRGWLKLQQGILHLQQGQLDEAMVFYRQGLDVFPGYWLIEEHIAEIDAMQNRPRQAESKYRDLIQRTQSPVFMIALADVLQQRSGIRHLREASMWLEQAKGEFDKLSQVLPESTSGHALDYYLAHGNIIQALELAEFHYGHRPDGATSVALIQAHLVAGNIKQAHTVTNKVFDSPFRSAELHATASVLFEILNDSSKAEREAVEALKINPLIFDNIDWLIEKVSA